MEDECVSFAPMPGDNCPSAPARLITVKDATPPKPAHGPRPQLKALRGQTKCTNV